MEYHLNINPTPAIVDALGIAVPLNNEGLVRFNRGDYAGSEKCFLEALRIKSIAYGEDSVHMCISLSGLADTYLRWGKLNRSRQEAERMLGIATRIGNAEQQRIANEILADLNVAEGRPAKR